MTVRVAGGVICVNCYWHEDCYGSCFTRPSFFPHLVLVLSLYRLAVSCLSRLRPGPWRAWLTYCLLGCLPSRLAAWLVARLQGQLAGESTAWVVVSLVAVFANFFHPDSVLLFSFFLNGQSHAADLKKK